jgi:hypothetical protein
MVSVSEDTDCCEGFHHVLNSGFHHKTLSVSFSHSKTAPSHPVLFLRIALKPLSYNPCLSTSLPQKHAESDLLE